MSNQFIRQFDDATSKFAGTDTPAKEYTVKVLAIRGYANVGAPGNDFGIYDDLIVICIGDETHPFKASTDPGIFYIKNPMNPKGCAVLTEAVHYFKPGKHDGEPAFVQAESVLVYRLDKDGEIAGKSWLASSLNLHCGSGLGAGGAGDDVGQLSAGCQIIYNPPGYFQGDESAPWYQFYELLSGALKKYGQKVFPYKLIAAGDMV